MLKIIIKKTLTICAVISLSALVSACGSDVTESKEYQAACHGQPLKGIAARNQAIEDGFAINEKYKCIDKRSYDAYQERMAERAYALSPEGIAEREAREEAEHQKRLEEIEIRRAERMLAEANKPQFVFSPSEINTATAEELAAVCSIRADSAEDIVDERDTNGRFESWPDVVHRVLALHSAQNAMFASICGLTVNGESLAGAPADEHMAEQIFNRYNR